MRKATMLLTLMIIASSCGKDPQVEDVRVKPSYSVTACQNSPALGSWTSSNGSKLTVTQDCHYTNTICGEYGIFPPVSELNGYAEIYVENKSTQAPSACMNLGFNNCYYQISSNQMTVVCGDVGGTYYKSGSSYIIH